MAAKPSSTGEVKHAHLHYSFCDEMMSYATTQPIEATNILYLLHMVQKHWEKIKALQADLSTDPRMARVITSYLLAEARKRNAPRN